MADMPTREYSFGDIQRAGKVLSGVVHRTPEAIEAFKVAHNWRMAHLYPLMRERIRLTRYSGVCGGGTTSGRIKQMSSIRKKLKRGSANLRGMQDLAGCRAIMDSPDGVQRILEKYRESHSHLIHRETDYIEDPKPGGYRSAHIIITFEGGGKGINYTGQKLEIQVRTKIQHVWATAVEAVGFVRQEDMKAGLGDASWLRLMELMSAYLAEKEGLPVSSHVPKSRRERADELRALESDLSAIKNLETYHGFMKIVEGQAGSYSGYYQLSLDTRTGSLSVMPRWTFAFSEAAHDVSFDDDDEKQDVMVSVTDLSSLRAAFPNYFYDVKLFLNYLTEAVKTDDKIATSFSGIDLSFLRGWGKGKR